MSNSLKQLIFAFFRFKILEEADGVQPLRDAAFEKKQAVDKALKDVLDAREADNDRLEAAQRLVEQDFEKMQRIIALLRLYNNLPVMLTTIAYCRDEARIREEEKAARDEIGALERSAKARANTMKRNVADIARVADEIEKEKQKVIVVLTSFTSFWVLSFTMLF